MRRLAQFVRLRASRVSRLSRVCLRLRAFVSRASRVCLASVCVCVHLSRVRLASVCVCSRQGFRMRASVVLSRVCLASCLASASVSRLSRVCLLVNACGDWLILCRSSFKEFKRFLLSSYYRCTYRLCRLYEQTFNILI